MLVEETGPLSMPPTQMRRVDAAETRCSNYRALDRVYEKMPDRAVTSRRVVEDMRNIRDNMYTLRIICPGRSM